MAAPMVRQIFNNTKKFRLNLPFLVKNVSLSNSKQIRLCTSLSSTSTAERPIQIEVSTEEWSYVEKLLPKKTVPEPPVHNSYPTPSGWVPQKVDRNDGPYFVGRTKYHNFPVHLDQLHFDQSRKLTIIRKIEGDIWLFERDLREFLENYYPPSNNFFIYTQVNEICRWVRVKGIHLEPVSKFLLEKGF